VNVADFIVEVAFRNLSAATVREWDYGFVFRDDYDYKYAFLLPITSNGDWALYTRITDQQHSSWTTLVQSGSATSIDTSAIGYNRLRLICWGPRGSLFINDQLAAELDLGGIPGSGGIGVATVFGRERVMVDFAIGYENFTVWRLPSP
jgi:hypothetical protein